MRFRGLTFQGVTEGGWTTDGSRVWFKIKHQLAGEPADEISLIGDLFRVAGSAMMLLSLVQKAAKLQMGPIVKASSSAGALVARNIIVGEVDEPGHVAVRVGLQTGASLHLIFPRELAAQLQTELAVASATSPGIH